ncbi:MAG: alpha/beta hydrolase, partial [Rhodospirillaceae bacterium]|nr:alpha/beta hydrolase [Rhodospirillaceae bacterium]
HPDAFGKALAETDDQPYRSRHHKAFLDPETEALFLADSARQFRETLASHDCPAKDVDAYLQTLGTEAALGAAVNWYRAAGGNLTAKSGDGTGPGLGPITVPTLYIWGDEDNSVGPDAARWTADFVTAPYTFCQLDGVGHFITDQKPGAATEPLLSHLARHDS